MKSKSESNLQPLQGSEIKQNMVYSYSDHYQVAMITITRKTVNTSWIYYEAEISTQLGNKLVNKGLIFGERIEASEKTFQLYDAKNYYELALSWFMGKHNHAWLQYKEIHLKNIPELANLIPDTKEEWSKYFAILSSSLSRYPEGNWLEALSFSKNVIAKIVSEPALHFLTPYNGKTELNNLNYYNSKLEFLIRFKADALSPIWEEFAAELRCLISSGYTFRKNDLPVASYFNSEAYLIENFISMINAKKNDLVRNQNYEKVAVLREVERKFIAIPKEEEPAFKDGFFTLENNTIRFSQPDNLFLEALLKIHLGLVLHFN